MSIKGIIFDMDGVISDTQKFHSKITSGILKKFGVIVSPEEITVSYSGVKAKDIFEHFLEGKNYELDKLLLEKDNKIKEVYENNTKPVPGAIDLIKKLNNEGFVLAVASSSSLDHIQIALDSLKIRKYFKALTGGNEVSKGKPNPEIFLLASSKIGLSPKECIVVEDSLNGMKGAKRAGMKCIGLVRDIEKEYPTKNIILSLKDLDLGHLNDLK